MAPDELAGLSMESVHTAVSGSSKDVRAGRVWGELKCSEACFGLGRAEDAVLSTQRERESRLAMSQADE